MKTSRNSQTTRQSPSVIASDQLHPERFTRLRAITISTLLFATTGMFAFNSSPVLSQNSGKPQSKRTERILDSYGSPSHIGDSSQIVPSHFTSRSPLPFHTSQSESIEKSSPNNASKFRTLSKSEAQKLLALIAIATLRKGAK